MNERMNELMNELMNECTLERRLLFPVCSFNYIFTTSCFPSLLSGMRRGNFSSPTLLFCSLSVSFVWGLKLIGVTFKLKPQNLLT